MFEGILQPMHLIVILIIALLIFGPGKLPELGSSLGKAIRGFKKAMEEPDQKSVDVAEIKKIEDQKSASMTQIEKIQDQKSVGVTQIDQIEDKKE